MSIPAFPVFSEMNADPGRHAQPERREGLIPGHTTGPANAPHCGSPGFGAGASATQRETIRFGRGSPQDQKRNCMLLTSLGQASRPGFLWKIISLKGCSLLSMEPLREWFCKGTDMTSPAEYEAALCWIEDDPPDIRQYHENSICEERWTHFSLEGVKLPTATVESV